MRKIVQMSLEVGLLDNKANNPRCQQLREAYAYVDDALSERVSSPAKLAEALVVGDFPTYFGRTIGARVMQRYEYVTSDWKTYTYADTVPGYLTVPRYRFSEFDRPVLRREKEEAYTGSINEQGVVTLAVDDYAKQLDFSNRILVDDDLGAFDDLALKMGDSARMFEDFYVSSLYDNAVTQAALIALGANYAGTGRLTTANLAIAINAFTQRVDARGNILRLTPKYLVIPPILRLTANQILQSDRIAELATNGINPLKGSLTVIEDPYIAVAPPNVPWYLFCAPTAIQAVTVVRRQGIAGPRLFAKAPDKMPMTTSGSLGAADWRAGSFLTGDIELMIETTIGSRNNAAGTLVGVTDANGIYYSNGTTP
jgi:hypothetical protein